MNRSLAISVVIGLSTLAGCAHDQQPQSAASCPECRSCGDIEAERDRLAQEAEQFRQLAARRQAIYDQLRSQLAELIEAGQVQLVFRRGMIVMQLPNQILFGAGRAELTADGSSTLRTIGEALSSIADRRFLVAGHTDNQPIQASTWRSNWHLSSARAQAVLTVLLEAGVSPDQLAAAGFGEFDTVADNGSPEGQAQNRRTEIMVVPNLEQLFNSIETEPASE